MPPIRTWLRPAIVFLGVAAAATVAHAGPPYVTDDPVPVELHHWEVYVATVSEITHDGATGTFPDAEVNYGGAPNLQLHARVPIQYLAPNGGPATFSLDELELGAKYRFVEEGAHVPMIATFPALEIPVSGDTDHPGDDHVQAFFPLWLQKSWGQWTSYGGGGYWVNPGEGNQNFWLAGWQIQCQLTQKVSLGGEVFSTSADHPGGRASPRFNVGMVVDFTDHHHLLFSAGHTLSGDVAFQGYLGYQLTI